SSDEQRTRPAPGRSFPYVTSTGSRRGSESRDQRRTGTGVSVVQPASVPLALPAIAQARGDAIDGQVDSLNHALVGIAGAVALEQLDLQVVDGIEIGETVADRPGEQRILLQQDLLLHDGEHRLDRILPFSAESRKDPVAQAAALDQVCVARGDRD